MSQFVLDTSAVLAVLFDEPERGVVEAILRDETEDTVIHLAFVTLMEAEYRSLRRRARSEAVAESMSLVRSWPVVIHESDPEWGHAAARIKARGGLSLADAWIASLALRLDAHLVHKDREFDAVPNLKAVRL